MSQHSPLAPSAADRWGHCPASVALSSHYPQLIEHPSGPEGTAAHWVVYSVLNTHTPKEGDIAPNGVAVTDEMLEGAKLYYNHVFKLTNGHGGLKTRFRFEQREHMPSIHPECHGTPDGAGIIDIAELTGEVHILDYKFGFREVNPTSLQLVLYLRGVLDRLAFDGAMEQHLRVHLHIIQPRCYTADGPIRTWSGKASDLRGQWNLLRDAAERAMGANPGYKVGDYCEFCPGRRACPELKKQGSFGQDYAYHPGYTEIPVEELGLELTFVRRSLDVLKARESGLAEQVEANIRGSQPIGGWALERGRGSVRWTAPITEVHAMGDMMEVNLRKEAAPTPTQARKLFTDANVDTSVIDAYSEHIPGAVKLVPANKTLAHKAFGAK